MGMFDYVSVEFKMPKDFPPQDGGWQTKDLANSLHVYRIDKHGYLFLDKVLLGNGEYEPRHQHLPDFNGDVDFGDGVQDIRATFERGVMTRAIFSNTSGFYEEVEYSLSLTATTIAT